jgi:hypothetical protein
MDCESIIYWGVDFFSNKYEALGKKYVMTSLVRDEGFDKGVLRRRTRKEDSGLLV